MKTRDMRDLGFRPFIDGEGDAVWVLPAMVVSEAMARELRPLQVSAALKKVSERAAAGALKLDPPPAAPAAP